jgi:hypothetical protein
MDGIFFRWPQNRQLGWFRSPDSPGVCWRDTGLSFKGHGTQNFRHCSGVKCCRPRGSTRDPPLCI